MAKTTTQKTQIDKELVKAKAREQVASRKLDRLKDRYDRLKVITDTQFESHAGELEELKSQLADSLARNEELAGRLKAIGDEAAMWKSQLFDQLDRWDTQRQEYLSLQTELAEAQWQMVELLNEERTRCELDRARSEAQVDQLRKELTASRARVDGLKNLGTCLTAKLERATAQRTVLQREHARLVELADERARQVESKDEEAEGLRIQLFEARRQILSYRLQSESWEALKEGLDNDGPDQAPANLFEWDVAAHLIAESPMAVPVRAVGHRQLKLAPLPTESSSPQSAGPLRLLQRATKTVGGWFRISPKKH